MSEKADRLNRTLEDLPDKFIECRKRHRMVPGSDENIVWSRKRIVQYTETEHCERGCGYVVKRIIDARTGDVIGNAKTTYNDKTYLIGHKVTRAEVRLESFRRRYRDGKP